MLHDAADFGSTHDDAADVGGDASRVVAGGGIARAGDASDVSGNSLLFGLAAIVDVAASLSCFSAWIAGDVATGCTSCLSPPSLPTCRR